jgi:hypothetical protein
MQTNLLKIEKTIKGTAQLFTAMDKGFAKVESDLTLLRNFRLICFEANEKLESALPQLQNHIIRLNATMEISSDQFNHVISDVLFLQQVINENILAISDYIDRFEELWKTSFSLNALLKFKFLLNSEFTVLENQIHELKMEHMRNERAKIINLQPSSKTQVYDESNLIN